MVGPPNSYPSVAVAPYPEADCKLAFAFATWGHVVSSGLSWLQQEALLTGARTPSISAAQC